MRFALACQGVTKAVDHLLAITQTNNVRVINDARIITWLDRQTGIQKGVYYPLEYQFLVDRQQYSLLLADGSFFQFFYRFDANDLLQEARLAFYPRPISTAEEAQELMGAAEAALDRDDEMLYEHLYNWTELMEQSRAPSNTSHLRFDFDRGATAHSQSHLQFGGVQELRVAADFYPQPLAFVQLCEGLLKGVDPLNPAGLGFERNNCLRLARWPQVISLGSLTPV